MTDNPYAQPNDYAGGPEYLEPKTSALAVIAFVISLVGLIACCIPGVGPLGLLLGVLALVMIGASGGRKKGGGFAIAAIIMGLIAGVINIAFVWGAMWTADRYASQAEVVTAIEANDADAVRGYLTSGAAAELTEARVAEIQAALAADWGASRERAQGALDLLGMLRKADAAVANAVQDVQAEYPPSSYQTMPVPLNFDNGLGYIFVVSGVGQQSFPPLSENIAFLRPDGTVLWLLPPPSAQGPALPPPAGSLPPPDPDASDPGDADPGEPGGS